MTGGRFSCHLTEQDVYKRQLKSFPPYTLGICLDTAHGWAAGYDFGTADGVKMLLEQFERLIGLGSLYLLHLNDAKVARGSRVDRHEHIGRGQIGRDGFRELLRQPWPEGMPVILETPDICLLYTSRCV